MRNFIDIIGSALTPTLQSKQKMDILMEGKHFEAMFNTLESLGQRYHQNDILETVQECKNIVQRLKRSDRQAWAARILRLWMFENLSKWSLSVFDGSIVPMAEPQSDPFGDKKKEIFETFMSEVHKLDTKYQNEYLRTIGEDWTTDGRNDAKALIKNTILNHYLGIPYSKIQNYVFNKSITDTIADLVELDNEYKERTKSLVTLHSGDKIIIRMPDDFVWVMLDRGYCSEEASAMGHCGNAGARSGDNILSLRKIKDTVDGVLYMEVFLTFILQNDGYLGEMKGRGNDKPAARYHSQIITLLQNPIIKGIRGGGWLPKNNFNINDLPEDVRSKLIDSHPHLGNWATRINKALKDGTFDAIKGEFITAFKECTSWTTHAAFDDNRIVAHKWKSIEDFVDDMSDDELTKRLSTNEMGVFENYYDVSDDSIESLIDSLPVQYQIAMGNIALGYLQDDGDEDVIENFDPSSSSEVLEILKDNNDDNVDHLKHAVLSGEESGTEEEAHKALVSAIENFTPEKGKGNIVFSTYERADGTTGWTWDSPIKLIMTIDDAAKILDEVTENGNGDEYEYDDDVKTMVFGEDAELKAHQPHYGFSGYNEDNAIERFMEETTIESENIERKPPEPDFDTMSIEDAKAWMEAMYAKIPDGFIRKVHPDTLPDDRVRASAKGLFKKYYG